MGRMRKILFLILVFSIGWLVIRFVIGGSEDAWICVDGEWIRHGYPSADMPEGSCVK